MKIQGLEQTCCLLHWIDWCRLILDWNRLIFSRTVQYQIVQVDKNSWLSMSKIALLSRNSKINIEHNMNQHMNQHLYKHHRTERSCWKLRFQLCWMEGSLPQHATDLPASILSYVSPLQEPCSLLKQWDLFVVFVVFPLFLPFSSLVSFLL